MLAATRPDRHGTIFVRRGTMIVIFLLSFPWSSFSIVGAVFAFLWAGIAALILAWEVGSGLIMTATSGASMVLAFSQGLGEAVHDGTTIEGVTASAVGVQTALLALVMFLIMLAGTSYVTRRIVRVVWVPKLGPTAERKDTGIALVAFVAFCFVAAVSTGTWTAWGGASQTEDGGFRLELFYPSSVVALWCYGTLGWWDQTLRPRWTELSGIIGVVVALLIFGLQSRRLMISAAILVALAFVMTTGKQAMGRLALQLGLVLTIVTVFTLGSSGWRDVGSDENPALTDRIERAVEAVGNAKSLESVGTRLTYLWFDASVHDLSRTQAAEIDGLGVFLSDLAAAVPRVLFAAKNEVEVVSCETGVEGFSGLDGDMPCTPTSEGFLMGGYLGVLLAGLLWGLALGVVDASIERGPGLARVFGLFLFFPFVLVETGVFAIVPALRLAVIGVCLVAAVAFAVRLLPRTRIATNR